MGNSLTSLRGTPMISEPSSLRLPPEPKLFAPHLTTLLETVGRLIDELKYSRPSNPGGVADLHRRCTEILPSTFSGGRFAYNLRLDNSFHLHPSRKLKGILPPQPPSPQLVGELDTSGNLYASVVHCFDERIRCRLTTHIRDIGGHMSQLAIDCQGKDYTTTMMLGNQSFIQDTGIISCGILKALTPSLAVGAELVYEYGPVLNGGFAVSVVPVMRYETPNAVWCGTFGVNDVHLSYFHQMRQNLQMGIEVKKNVHSKKMQATIAYQLDFPENNMTLRTSLNSNWHLVAALEQRLHKLPVTFHICVQLHDARKATVGCSLTVE